MNDLKDREPRLDERIFTPETRALVSRAIAPILRFTNRDLAPGASRDVALRIDPTMGIGAKKRTQTMAIKWSFVIVVLVPVVLSSIYFLLLASSQYAADARFAVRETDLSFGKETASEKGGSADGAGGGFGLSLNMKSQNAEIVASYIKSRAIIDDISRTMNVRAIFRRPEADFLARLPSDASEEQFATYWNRMVSVYIETSSGIVTVSASAFRRDDALALVKAIIVSSEQLVNSLSNKIRDDHTRLAEDEVRRSEGEVRFALANLQSFRNSEHLIDPVKTSTSTGKLMFQLISSRIEAEVQLDVAQKAQGPNAPGITSLKAKLDSIKGQIKSLQEQMAGDDEVSKNMAAALSRFEELELKKQFAEKLFAFAQTGVERARMIAMRQSIYLSVFMQPSLPEDYSYPLRFTNVLLIALGTFMVWISGLTISASILDHRL